MPKLNGSDQKIPKGKQWCNVEPSKMFGKSDSINL